MIAPPAVCGAADGLAPVQPDAPLFRPPSNFRTTLDEPVGCAASRPGRNAPRLHEPPPEIPLRAQGIVRSTKQPKIARRAPPTPSKGPLVMKLYQPTILTPPPFITNERAALPQRSPSRAATSRRTSRGT